MGRGDDHLKSLLQKQFNPANKFCLPVLVWFWFGFLIIFLFLRFLAVYLILIISTELFRHIPVQVLALGNSKKICIFTVLSLKVNQKSLPQQIHQDDAF